MKYRYLIYDSFDGDIKGTNDEQTAMEFSAVDDFMVVDAQSGMMMVDRTQEIAVQEIQKP